MGTQGYGSAYTASCVPTREAVEAVLGFRVIRWPGHYITALTHKSAAGTVPGAADRSYESLEYLGDSILSFIVAAHLYASYPRADEGMLTQLRSKLVSDSALASVARKMGIDTLVIVSAKAQRHGLLTNPRLVADCFEALVAAVYLDSGLLAAKTYVLGMLKAHVDWGALSRNENWKDRALQRCQAKGVPLPVYTVRSDPRAKEFAITAYFENRTGVGEGSSKRAAEQAAARDALRQLGELVD